MSAIHLTFVDWLIIAIYFAFILGIGFYLKRFTKNQEDFFMAGRKNSAWVAGLAFLSANLGALELLGMTGNTFKYGMYVAHFYWIGAIPAMLFLGLYMMPFYYSSRIHSVPGLSEAPVRREDARAERVRLRGHDAAGVRASTSTRWRWCCTPSWAGTGTSACGSRPSTVAVYVTLSGLLSAIFTEIIQFFLIWFGLFLVSVLGIVEIGGIDEVFARIPPSLGTLWSTSGDAAQNGMAVTWAGIVLGLGFVLSFGYWTTDFLVVQRAFSAKDLRSARMTPIIASFFKMAVPFLVIMAGLVALDPGQRSRRAASRC